MKSKNLARVYGISYDAMGRDFRGDFCRTSGDGCIPEGGQGERRRGTTLFLLPETPTAKLSMYRRPCRVQTRPNATTTRSSATSSPHLLYILGFCSRTSLIKLSFLKSGRVELAAKCSFAAEGGCSGYSPLPGPHKRCFQHVFSSATNNNRDRRHVPAVPAVDADRQFVIFRSHNSIYPLPVLAGCAFRPPARRYWICTTLIRHS
jgi:hypothetical protein